MSDVTRCNYCVLLDLRRKHGDVTLRGDTKGRGYVNATSRKGEHLATFMAVPLRCSC